MTGIHKRKKFPDPTGSSQCGSGACDLFAMDNPKPNFMLLDRFPYHDGAGSCSGSDLL